MKAKYIRAFLIILLLEVSHGQYLSRMRSNLNPLYTICRDPSSSYPCDDFECFITLLRAIEERDCAVPPINNGNCFNAESLITKLVNALIDITTQALTQNTCHCPNSSNSCTGATCTNNTNGGSGGTKSNGPLIGVDLFDPNKNNNVLELDVGQQPILGIGVGRSGNDGGSQSTKGNSNTNSSSGKNDESIINLDLLNPNNVNNVLQANVLKQPLVGVELGASPVPANDSGATNSSNTGT